MFLMQLLIVAFIFNFFFVVAAHVLQGPTNLWKPMPCAQPKKPIHLIFFAFPITFPPMSFYYFYVHYLPPPPPPIPIP